MRSRFWRTVDILGPGRTKNHTRDLERYESHLIGRKAQQGHVSAGVDSWRRDALHEKHGEKWHFFRSSHAMPGFPLKSGWCDEQLCKKVNIYVRKVDPKEKRNQSTKTSKINEQTAHAKLMSTKLTQSLLPGKAFQEAKLYAKPFPNKLIAH